MRIRQALCLAAAALACAQAQAQPNAPTAPAAPAAPLSLQEALAAARSNLEVAIATRGVGAAAADVLAADHAPLPQLSAKVSQIDLQNGVGPGNWFTAKRVDKGIGIDWTWERGDKRALRTEAARRGAGAAEADLDEVRLQQALAAHAAFFDLLAAQGRLEQLQAIERSALLTAETARKRQAAGDIALQEAARAAIEADRARADSDSAALAQRRAQLALAQITGLPSAAMQVRDDWPATRAANDPSDPSDPSDEREAPAFAALLERRADVHAAALRLQAAQAALQSATAMRQSDITVGTSLDHIPGTSTRQLELRASMPLTWGYRYEGETARAQAQLEQARDALERTRRAAGSELMRLHAEFGAAARRAERFDADIVPRAREVAARADLAYAKGAMPLTDLLDARRTLRAVLLDALAARTELAKASGAWSLRSNTAAESRLP